MEVLAALIGAGVVAVSPFVPVLRPIAKTAVKGALAVSDAVVGTVTLVSQQVNELVAESKAELDAAAAAEAEVNAAANGAAPQTGNIPVINEEVTTAKGTVKDSVTAAAGVVMKGSMAVADKAKGAATATGKQLSNLVTETKSKAPANTAVRAKAPAEKVRGKTAVADDLAQIKGIGPKSVELLQAASITTFAQLAATDEAQLRHLLATAGGRFKMINPSSWPEQARQLAEVSK
jgi:predicted flap endonuclease-1-like 5' DNA nuclease